jgi:hypothetical protein
MNRFAVVRSALVVTFVAGLASTSSAQVSGVPDVCYSDAPSCRNIKVTVEGGKVVLDPASINIAGRTTPITIVWYLATPGYKFAGPVELPADRVITRNQFEPADNRFCYWWRSETVYVCSDRNYANADVPYTVKVIGGSASSPLLALGRVLNN